MLGTGTPNCEPDRCGPSQVIIVNNTPYLIDCGAGVVRRTAACGIDSALLESLFITHLHSDHTIGYPDVILSPAVLGRSGPLKAFGPPGLAHMTDHILTAYAQDIQERVHGLEGGNPDAYEVVVNEISPGVIYEDANVRVSAFPVKHGTWQHAFGYRFTTPDKNIVISGDSIPQPELIANARGCDILVHEVYSQAGFANRPARWQKYHKNAHTSTWELAAIANEVKPELLVLTHVLLWGSTPEQLLKEVGSTYPGKVCIANDLDEF